MRTVGTRGITQIIAIVSSVHTSTNVVVTKEITTNGKTEIYSNSYEI